MEYKLDSVSSQTRLPYDITYCDIFKTDKNYNQFLEIYEGKSKISLRIIDWFVTNYCKKYDINWKCNENFIDT